MLGVRWWQSEAQTHIPVQSSPQKPHAQSRGRGIMTRMLCPDTCSAAEIKFWVSSRVVFNAPGSMYILRTITVSSDVVPIVRVKMVVTEPEHPSKSANSGVRMA